MGPGAIDPETLRDLALDGLPDVSIVVFDTDLRIQGIFGGAATRRGYDRERVTGRLASEVLPAQAWAQIRPAYEAALAGKTTTFDVATADGTEIFLTTFEPVVVDGRVVGGTARSLEVSERRQAERKLQATSELLETAFSFAPIGKVISVGGGSTSGRIIKCNAAFASMLGYATADIVGRTGISLVHPDDRGQHRALIAEANRKTAANRELRLVRKDGRAVWAQISVSRVRDEFDRELRLVQAIDITARKEAEAQLRHIADHDDLTGIRGRRAFEEQLSRAARNVRRGHTAALLLVDLNGFKAVNDTLGHQAGDVLLTTIAAALTACVRADDIVARIGGDEFAVLLPYTDRTGAQRVVDNIERAVALQGTARSGDQCASVTAAIGMTMLTADEHLTPEEALHRADAAMYRSKRASRALAAADQPAAAQGRIDSGR